MTATLELYDGTTTIDLLASPYFASGQARMSPPRAEFALAGQTLRGVRYSPREFEVNLNVRASGVASLRDRLRALESMLAAAESRAAAGAEQVKLRCQLGNANARDVGYGVLRGEVELPATLLQEPELSTVHAASGVRLRMLVEPFGRLAEVTPTASALRNEQDGSSRNYIDFTMMRGTHGAKLQLKIEDSGGTWTGSKRMWIAKRSGARRTDALFFQAEDGTTERGTSPTGSGSYGWDGSDVSSALASGGKLARMEWATSGRYRLGTEFTLAGRARVSISGARIPRGLFRVLARCRPTAAGISLDEGETMGFALGWEFGSHSKTPTARDAVYPPSRADDPSWEMYDLGELLLEPMAVPNGYIAPTFMLDVHGFYHNRTAINGWLRSHLRWDVDYVTLLPIDEGAVILNGVGPSDRVLMDTLSDTPGVYLLNSSDVVQRFADFAGGPFGIGAEDTRIYFVRDDSGDPSSVGFRVTPKYSPLVAGV